MSKENFAQNRNIMMFLFIIASWHSGYLATIVHKLCFSVAVTSFACMQYMYTIVEQPKYFWSPQLTQLLLLDK